MRASQRSQPVAGINVLRWELGNELRRLRNEAGKSIAEAARTLECSEAKISRMENGQRGALARDVRDLCRLYGVPAQRRDELIVLSREAQAADQSSSSTIPAKYATYVALEQSAQTLRSFESTVMPGLLQTARYARTIIEKNGDFEDQSEIEDRVRVRMDRQRRIWSDPEPLRAHFVIDENVLWRPAGVDPESRAMREEQMDRLIQATRLPHVTLQIVPYEAGFYQGMEGGTIILLDLDEGTKQNGACYVEGVVVDLFVRGHSETNKVAEKFANMAKQALSPGDTRKFLMRLVRGNYEHWSSARSMGPAGVRRDPK